MEQNYRSRMEKALDGSPPGKELFALAHALKEEGMSQIEMHRLFDEFRAKHENDADESRYDAILDTMDIIVGYCNPSQRLFDTYLQT